MDTQGWKFCSAKSPHLQPSFEASSGRGQLTFNSRNKSYTVRGSDDPDPDVGGDDDGIDSDWLQVAGGREEEEEDELLASNRRFNRKTFAAYRSKDSAPLTASKSISPKRRQSFERSVPPERKRERLKASACGRTLRWHCMIIGGLVGRNTILGDRISRIRKEIRSCREKVLQNSVLLHPLEHSRVRSGTWAPSMYRNNFAMHI